jgi:amino acid transporter
LGYVLSLSSLSVYLEYAAYFPSRSGSEVAYLEQAYPRPKWFFPTVFAMQTVLLSFRSSNAIVMAKYLFAIGDHAPTAWESKGLAVACYTLAVACVLFNTKGSFMASNAIGVVKLLTLVFISILGLVVLGGHTAVEDPSANFRNAFRGDISPYGVTNSLYKIIFSCNTFRL